MPYVKDRDKPCEIIENIDEDEYVPKVLPSQAEESGMGNAAEQLLYGRQRSQNAENPGRYEKEFLEQANRFAEDLKKEGNKGLTVGEDR